MSYKDIPLIKVLIGIRKCGKTTILQQYISLLKEENKESIIIFINLNDFYTSSKIYDLASLNQYIAKHYDENKKNYLFIEEIQEIKDFQIIINSWCDKQNMDVYITGSNSKLLSSELSTLITGKNMVIKVYPLAFSELCDKNIPWEEKKKIFSDFLKYGGMPGRLAFNGESEIYSYLNMIYCDIVQKEILSRHTVASVVELSGIYKFICENSGKEISYKNVWEILKTNKSTLSQTTVAKYVELLTISFLLQKINKFKLFNSIILENSCKYYPQDTGMKNAIFKDFTHSKRKLLESIVFNELKYRGYEVFIGTSRTISEIDFVAKNNSETLYFQVSEILTEDNIEREITPLLKIKDSNPKIVLSLEELESKDKDGIKYRNLIKWLLSDEIDA